MHRKKRNFNSHSFCVNLLRIVPNKPFASEFSIIFLLFKKVCCFPFSSSCPPSSPTQMCITSCALLSPHLCSCSQPFYTNPSLLKTQQSNVWVPVQPSHPSHLWLKIFAYCSKTGKYKIYHFNHFKCIVQ